MTDTGATERRRARRRRYSLASWAILVLGCSAALGAAISWTSTVSSRDRAAFRTDAESTAASIVTSIRRDEDFVASQAAIFATLPGLDNRLFALWYRAVDVPRRYPGGLGFSFVERVPAARLRAFAATLSADPITNVTTPPASRYRPYPPGARAVYCLPRYGYYSGPLAEPDAARFDFCAPIGAVSPFPSRLALAMDTGRLTAAPPIFVDPGVFFLVAPVYRGGVTPRTLAERRRALLGWALGTFNGNATLDNALTSVRGLAVRLSYVPSSGPPVAVAAAGSARPRDAYRTELAAGPGGRWLLSITGGPPSAAFSEGLVVGGLVLAVTVAIFLAIQLLLRSRERALLLVDERTGELRHQALHDSLTGLPNRALVVDRAERMLQRARREPLAIGVLFIDLDNFKDVNDSFGHQRGDDLLVAVARRLEASLRPSDSVGRLGGDEFVVLVEGRSLDAGPELVAERILTVLSEPFVLEGLEFSPLSVRASIGVAVGLRPDAEELLRDADIALYQAKQSGKGRYALFHPEMQLAIQDRLAFEMDLRAAVERGQLFVEYQPTFDMRDLTMTGVEALVRWRHPERGVVAPGEFIPVAEECGLIGEIGRFVLQEACRQAAAWAAGGRVVPLSVNVSGRQLESDALVGEVEEALLDSGLDPGLLTLELTETVLMHDAEATSRRLHELKRLGVRIAIDDFGTGYSSLAYLRQFPVDALKIDRSFISEVARSPEARALIHTLVQLGRAIGLRTLAEGVEDEAQLAQLQREQCDHGQGFYYSRPLPAEAVETLFAPVGTPG